MNRKPNLSLISACLGKSDVVFLLDSSCSVGKENFQKLKHFVSDVTYNLYIDKNGIQMGVESYECKVHTNFELNRFHNKVQMQSAINNIEYKPGGTNTGEAIKHMWTRSFSSDYGKFVYMTILHSRMIYNFVYLFKKTTHILRSCYYLIPLWYKA